MRSMYPKKTTYAQAKRGNRGRDPKRARVSTSGALGPWFVKLDNAAIRRAARAFSRGEK